MAQREFKFKTLADGTGWSIHNPITDTKLGAITLPAEGTPAYHRVALYGLKQWANDGGAKKAGTSARDRLAAILKRGIAITSGLATFRDGHGTASAEFPDVEIWLACIAVQPAADTPDNRAKWAAASPGYRVRQLDRPDVRAAYDRIVPPVPAEADDEIFG
jgi:hypothetical protein